MSIFHKNKYNYKAPEISKTAPELKVGSDVLVTCSACKQEVSMSEMLKANYFCPSCHACNRIPARLRILTLCDKETFREHSADRVSGDPLSFPDYEKKLEDARRKTGEKEAVICGEAKLGGYECCIFAMDSRFMMASMGSAVGDKITALFEYATEKRLPVIGFAASGGARMQEGMVSLMQMAKTSGAIKLHSDAGQLFCSVLTDPTTGGVTASFAMLGDIIIAEPNALVGFAGRRVITQTTGEKLPDNFQSAEFQLENGFVDAIVERSELREYLASILALHSTASK